MTEQTYLIAIDAWNPDFDQKAVKEIIKNHPGITNWWNYIPFVFLVVSPLSADELSEALKPHTKDASLLVIETNTRNSEGLLPEPAWNWIRRRSRQPSAGLRNVGLKTHSNQA